MLLKEVQPHDPYADCPHKRILIQCIIPVGQCFHDECIMKPITGLL
jgi:hypothetical protein